MAEMLPGLPIGGVERWNVASTEAPERAVLLTLEFTEGSALPAVRVLLDHRDARAIANALIGHADHVVRKLEEDDRS
jgi:hypothetical protein